MTAPNPLPVSIIGGYLGAGKTTLVNHLLRHANGLKIAVLVNEFGALPIDADLIEAQDDTLISIAGGCVCCSYGNDLIQALLDLSTLETHPDHLLIECSGVALPGAIAASVSLLDGFRCDGITVMVDAETIRTQASDPYIGDTIERQLGDANVVVVNKADLVTQEDLEELHRWLPDLAAQAAVVDTERGQLPSALILQSFDHPKGGIHQSAAPHAPQFDTLVLHLPPDSNAEAVARILAAPEHGVIRAKGFLPTPEGHRALQLVGSRWEVFDAPPDVPLGIVVIARKGKNGLPQLQRRLLPGQD